MNLELSLRTYLLSDTAVLNTRAQLYVIFIQNNCIKHNYISCKASKCLKLDDASLDKCLKECGKPIEQSSEYAMSVYMRFN